MITKVGLLRLREFSMAHEERSNEPEEIREILEGRNEIQRSLSHGVPNL
jgi:hypothetical protein